MKKFIILFVLFFAPFITLDLTAAAGDGGHDPAGRWEVTYVDCSSDPDFPESCGVCNYPSRYGCSAPEFCQHCW